MNQGGIVKDMDYKNILISPGGSGTNYIYEVFGKRHLVGEWDRFKQDKWPNPHQRHAQFRVPTRVLYLMAHPLNILMSFNRRKFFKSIHAVQNLQGDVNGARGVVPCTLDEYARHGVNWFNFADHFEAWQWYCTKAGLPMLFVTYAAIGDNLTNIERFLKIPRAKILHFTARESDFNTLNTEVLTKLETVH